MDFWHYYPSPEQPIRCVRCRNLRRTIHEDTGVCWSCWAEEEKYEASYHTDGASMYESAEQYAYRIEAEDQADIEWLISEGWLRV